MQLSGGDVVESSLLRHAEFGLDFLVTGHTHVQEVYPIGGKVLPHVGPRCFQQPDDVYQLGTARVMELFPHARNALRHLRRRGKDFLSVESGYVLHWPVSRVCPPGF